MPRILTSKEKPPEGWEKIEATLEELERKMRDVESEPHEGKRRVEAAWPIMRVHHERTRYIYEMYYKKHEISKELYEFCLRNKLADAGLIAKWKKPGYERVCCLQCISKGDHNFETTCICRVPKSKLAAGKIVECVTCGCRGCASGD